MEIQNQKIFTFRLDDSEITIGRDSAAAISLQGFGISRIHAVVKLSQHPIITDANSRFGLRVNDELVQEKKLVQDDIVVIGIYRFRVTFTKELVDVVFTLLSVDNSESVTENIISSVQKIGRDESCDICLAHPLVSRYHATVQRENGTNLKITDNHSTNGTFVNGQAVSEQVLHNGDVVQVGPFRLFVDDDRIQHVERNRVHLDVSGVSVRGSDRLILDSVSLSIHPGEFVAVLGPSGAGKTTLAKVMSGRLHPLTGSVYVNNLPLKRYGAAFASHIGYVSQETMLYKELTVAETFNEQCRLRFPRDSTLVERDTRVGEVISLLGLTEVRDHRTALLSGGEMKRVHLGIELLSSPSIVFLDEPLSGLDPGLVRMFMQLFRRICDQGHTLVLITHTLEQIDFCDRIFFISRGKMLFSGSSSELYSHYGLTSLAELYEKASVAGLYHTENGRSRNDLPHKESAVYRELRRKKYSPFLVQTGLLVIRYFRVFARDRKNAVLTLLQAPLIAMLLRVLFGDGEQFLPVTFYFCIAISSIWIGGVSAVREFARDWGFLSRDVAGGVSEGAFIVSKTVVVSAIALCESLLFWIVMKLLFFKADFDPGLFVIAAAGIVSGAILGLCISAWSGNVGRAISLLPVIFIPQIMFSGIMIPFDRMNFTGAFISHLTIARPLFSMFKKVALLDQNLFSLNEWTALFYLACGLIILMIIAVRIHCRR